MAFGDSDTDSLKQLPPQGFRAFAAVLFYGLAFLGTVPGDAGNLYLCGQ